MTTFTIPRIQHPFDVAITLPGSKSIALRQLAISALCSGTSTLTAVPDCDDTDAMLDCLGRLGATVAQNGTQVQVTGPINFSDDVSLDARMSGASTRLLIGIAALRHGHTHIDGHPSLQVRTNQPLLDVLAHHGCAIDSATGGLPLTVRGPLQPTTRLEIDGSISSQYITALSIISPYITDLEEIIITGSLVSRPYIDITADEMVKRGGALHWADQRTLKVGRQTYSSGEVTIEGDATAASYFMALATLHGSRVQLTNLGNQTQQGDYQFGQVMQQLGARVESEPFATQITGPDRLQPLAPIDMTSMPDVALTLIAMAPALPADTHIQGLSTLHHKECDRLECSAAELRALGVAVQTTQDTITVSATVPAQYQPHVLNTYHDHRMAMAFSTLGSLTGNLGVDDAAVVNKTYPHYWQDYEQLLGAN